MRSFPEEFPILQRVIIDRADILLFLGVCARASEGGFVYKIVSSFTNSSLTEFHDNLVRALSTETERKVAHAHKLVTVVIEIKRVQKHVQPTHVVQYYLRMTGWVEGVGEESVAIVGLPRYSPLEIPINEYIRERHTAGRFVGLLTGLREDFEELRFSWPLQLRAIV